MGTLTRHNNLTYETTVAAGATEIYIPGLDYCYLTIFIEPASGGTASVEVTGDSVETVNTGSPVWHAASATLTDATANVNDGTEFGVNALRLSATTQNAIFKIAMKGKGFK